MISYRITYPIHPALTAGPTENRPTMIYILGEAFSIMGQVYRLSLLGSVDVQECS